MLRFLTAGESHGPCLTVILEGVPAGLPLTEDSINHELRRRQKGYGRGGRMKIEQDQVQILGGVYRQPHGAIGATTGAPLALQIENRDWANWQEQGWTPLTVPRPGHADLAGALKYGGTDARPILERASARETAARVAAGAVAKVLLAQFDIRIGSYVAEIGGIEARITPEEGLADLAARAEGSELHCPDPEAAETMREWIDTMRQAGNSVGGVFVVFATGVPIGLGSHAQWDRRLDARLAAAMMSIPAIKGVEIGPAFENARRPGTQVHDEIIVAQNARGWARASNRAGGIEGGISNGEPIILRAAMKPIPTTVRPLRSVDLASGAAAATQYQRSDVCAVPAASVVGEAMMAFVLADALMEKLGGDSLAEMKAHMGAAPL